MSVYGQWKSATIAKDGTTSDEIDLDWSYDLLEIIIPTIDAATVKIQVSEGKGGTYYDLGNSVVLASSTGNFADVLFLGGYRYVKVVLSATQTTAAVAIKVRGMRY